jgi:hypothetical protein
MKLGRRVRELERAALENAPPAPPPAEWRSEGERLRCALELFALGHLRGKQLEENDAGVKELVPRDAVTAMSDNELLSILGFKSLAAFARAEEQRRREDAERPELSRKEKRRRVIEVLRARRGES